MRLLIVGGGTPVGRELTSLLRQRKVAFHSLNERLLSMDKPELVQQVLARAMPDQVINLASYRSGSQQAAQQAERNPRECLLQNFRQVAVLAALCRERGLPLLQLSSPLVFDGEKKLGYNEQDDPAPLGVYGKSCQQAEAEVQRLEKFVILRSGWLFGPGLNDQIKGWIKAVRKHRGQLKVARRRLSPTATEDLARVILAISQQMDCAAEIWGTYHYCGLETKKESEFALQVCKYASQHDEHIYQLIDSLNIIETALTPPQIANATLSSKKLFDTFGIKQRSWHGSLQAAIKSIYHARGEGRLDQPAPLSLADQVTRSPH